MTARRTAALLSNACRLADRKGPWLAAGLLAGVLASCGGGSGGSSNATSSTAPRAVSTTSSSALSGDRFTATLTGALAGSASGRASCDGEQLSGETHPGGMTYSLDLSPTRSLVYDVDANRGIPEKGAVSLFEGNNIIGDGNGSVSPDKVPQSGSPVTFTFQGDFTLKAGGGATHVEGNGQCTSVRLHAK